MAQTRSRKIYRDIVARKGRTALVVISILIGVFGVTTMTSLTDLINRQLDHDLKSSAIAHAHVYVTSTGSQTTLAENQEYLARLQALPNVVEVEGQALYPVSWRKANAARFNDAYLMALAEPFDAAHLEAVSEVTRGRFPQPGSGEIAVEQRFADAHGIKLSSQLEFDQADGQSRAWTVVGLVLHPYFTYSPAIQDQIPPAETIYANYEDAQQIAGFSGLSAILVRYTDTASSESGQEALNSAIAAETPYVPLFTFMDDPDHDYIRTIIDQVDVSLNALGIIALIVAGFLVTNVMNAIITEQRRQIGTMKSLGASFWDNFAIYAGMALAYGAAGTALGVLIAVPVAALLAQQIGTMAFTYIAGIKFSPVGIGLGAVTGLLVPVLAALVPVLKGVRLSIRDAMTDLGIASTWGQSPVSRWIGRLPLPIPVVQALSNIYQKKGRLALTGLALTVAVAAFMGVTAVFASLNSFIQHSYDLNTCEITITPQNTKDFVRLAEIITGQVAGVEAVYPGYQASVGVEGLEGNNGLTGGSNQVTITGFDPSTPTLSFDLIDGSGWRDDPARQGVVISRSVADNLHRGVGDTITLLVNGQRYPYPIIGVDSGADAIFIDWRALATITGYVDAQGSPLTGLLYVQLAGDPSIRQVDEAIDRLSDVLRAQDIQATYTNQPKIAASQAQQVSLFGTIFNMTSATMAAVGAVGLMAALSMAVFERQKEIGVMRSVGATSFAVTSQFLLEGVLVGLLAWAAAAPLSVGLGMGLMQALPFGFLHFSYPPQVLGLGLGGVIVVAAVASLWPAIMASRRTVSDILRYQ
jgi:putative ABC transport system permease protein